LNSRRASSRPVTIVIANSHKIIPGRIDPPSHLRSLKDANATNTDTDTEMDVNADVDTSVRESEASTWTAALLPLVKGKTTMDEVMLAYTSLALSEIERASERESIPPGVLKVNCALSFRRLGRSGVLTESHQESALADTVRRLGELEDVPLGDEHYLRKRARTLADRWREMYGDEVVDLQRGIFLQCHAS
jgi:hypothetical protein